MRVFSVALIALASVVQVHAQEKIKTPVSSCNYTLTNGEAFSVPSGEALCWRVPQPSYREYSLLRCDAPSFQELFRVKQGDPRCFKYEERQ